MNGPVSGILAAVVAAGFLAGGCPRPVREPPAAEAPARAPQPAPKPAPPPAPSIASYDECVARGYPVMESWPAQCRVPGGRTFVQDIGNELEQADRIRIESPRPNQRVTSPLEVRGSARGNWFFEASFPVVLRDAGGRELARAPARAEGEWMTTDFVPFHLTLPFPPPATPRGLLVLERDNPSGLPENAEELRVPVRFGTGAQE